MVKMLVRFAMLISTLYAISEWLIIPIVTIRISDPALITCLICSIILMVIIVLPFVMKD